MGEMLESFYLKRSCKLNGQFFQYLTRKLPALKPVILKKCEELGGKNIRSAQKKEIAKMQNKLGKKEKGAVVKEE